MACWCKNTKDSTQSLSLLVGTEVFMLTSIDEEVVPLSGMLKGLCVAKDYTCTLTPWEVVSLKSPCPHNFHVVLPYLKDCKKKRIKFLILMFYDCFQSNSNMLNENIK